MNASEENEDGDWTTFVETPRVFKLIASLAADPARRRARASSSKRAAPARRETAVAERSRFEGGRREGGCEARERGFHVPGGDDVEVEVVAEKSLEEVEREKLRARGEGRHLDLTSSQVETVTTRRNAKSRTKKNRADVERVLSRARRSPRTRG